MARGKDAMDHSADVLVLTGDVAAAQELSAYVQEAGHRVLAVVASVVDLFHAVDVIPHQQRHALVLIAVEHGRSVAEAIRLATLVRELHLRVIYVARRAEDLAVQEGVRDTAGCRDPGDIACLLQPRELSLAIRLALCRPASMAESDEVEAGRGGARTGAVAPGAAALPASVPWFELLRSTPMTLYSSQARGHGRIRYASENVQMLLGRDVHEVTAASRFWLECVHPQDAPRLLGARARLREGETWTGEYRLQHKDGSYRWVHDTCMLARVPGERTPILLGAWLDITQQQNTRETLHALEMRLSLMFEDQTELICHFLPSGVLTFANDAYCRYFGKTQEALIGSSFMPLIPDEDMERVSQAFAALTADDPVGGVEHRVITADGALRWHSWTNRAILDDDGRIIEYQAVGRDITEQKLAEARIRQLNADLTRRAAELEAANAELEAFSFTASHDLRAPLRTIGSFCRLIEESHAEVLDARGKDYLRRVVEATQRMARLINDLLNLSRVSRTVLRLEECNISEMAHAILRELRLNDPAREVALALAPDVRVRADPALFRVVLENLLGNAWKYTAKSAPARIELGTTTHRGRPACFVRDNGAGFDMAQADKLFIPFQRLHGVDEFEGTGIGLATVKRIIQRHGGDIWARSTVGTGATFMFTLP